MTDEILRTFLNTNSLRELTNAAGRAMGCPFMVIDDSFHVAAYYRADGIADPYDGAIRHGELSYDESALIASSALEGEVLLRSPAGYHCRISELRCGELRMGYALCLVQEGALPAAPDEDFALINSFIAKQMYFERHRGGITATPEEVLVNLIEGKFKSQDFFQLQAKETYLGGFEPERFVLIKPAEPMDGLKTDMLRDRLRHDFHASNPFPYDDCIVLFLHGDFKYEDVSRAAAEYGLRAVISEPMEGLYSLCAGYRRVRRLLDYLMERNDGAFAAGENRYAVLMMIRLLANEGYPMGEKIEGLYRYDAENNSEYCLTLYTYLSCSRSLKDTCERLFTHRNTVLYRMRRIREDFSIDPDLPEERTALLLSLCIALVRQGHEELFIEKTESDNARQIEKER